MTTVQSIGGIPDSSSKNDRTTNILTVSELEDPIAEDDYPYWIIGVLCGVVVILGGVIVYGIYMQNQKNKKTAVVDSVPHNHNDDDGGEFSS